jgi:hypothetical protein
VLEGEEEGEEEVVQGLTSHMEMCDFFLFFWLDIKGLSLAQVKLLAFSLPSENNTFSLNIVL